eukprot:9864365-Heterocapsa_arctica.AAC.1
MTFCQLFKPEDFPRISAAASQDWTDVRCVSELFLLQSQFDLKGILPAHVFYTAIQNYDSNNHL